MYLIETVRLTDRIKADPHHALLIRRALFNIANEFPVAWERPRDERGRFRLQRETLEDGS
jgi:hypothetical protein